MSDKSVQIELQHVPADDLQAAFQLEIQGYPPEEAGSLDTFRYRHSSDPSLFLGAYAIHPDSKSLVGFISATRSSSSTLDHESMTSHDPNGPSICIHSVCVAQDMRKRGIALQLLTSFIQQATSTQGVSRILLAAHEELIPLYEKAGFHLVGKSDLVHGPRPWFELRLDLQPAATSGGSGLMAALSRANPPRSSSSYHELSLENVKTKDSTNSVDLLCPKEGCGSLILKAQVARLETREGIIMDSESHSLPTPLTPLPASSEWWLITPSPMQFENIGFTRPVGGKIGPTGKTVKLLTCAECDLGPLGWSEEGSREFWLSARRVRYLSTPSRTD